MSERPLHEFIDLEAYDVVTGDHHRHVVEQRDRALGALRIIASTTYPATFLGYNAKGVAMYGGSQDASLFAQQVLDEIAGKK